MDKIKEILEQADLNIKQGKLADARAELKPLLQKKLTTEEAEGLASLYRRLSLPVIAIRILRPIVIGSGRRLPQSSVFAKIEYGASLIQMDLVEEGRGFLSTPEVAQSREARRWYAMSFLYDFQFSRAAEQLEKLLCEYESNSYDYLVLKINLMAALLGNLTESKNKKLFDQTAKDVKQKLKLHHANRLAKSYESIYTQSVFFSESIKQLDLVELQPTDYLDFFRIFTSLFHEGRAGRLKKSFLDHQYRLLRAHALKNNWFEGVREIDFHYARLFQPQSLPLIKMGTRHQHYQERYLNHFSLSSVLCFARNESLLNLPQMKSPFEIQELPEAKTLRTLFWFLYTEQYAPLSSFLIWSILAPSEHFNGVHSLNRVHQWVKRLKFWLKSQKIPAKITSNESGYRLAPERLLACLVKKDLLTQMREQFTHPDLFSIHDIKKLDPEVSTRELQYRLKIFLEQGVLEKTGKARGVRYKMVKI